MARSITRRFEWDAAHRLTTHDGKCRNLHGHRYVAEVTVAGVVAEDGMLLDFAVLDRVVGGFIDEQLDHAAIVMSTDVIMLPDTTGGVGINGLGLDHVFTLAGLLEAQGWKVYRMPVETSAENLAELLFGVAVRGLAEHGVQVVSVRVWETPRGSATYP